MNSKSAFILMGVLIVLIPSVVYFLFSDQMHSTGSDIPSAPSSVGMSHVVSETGEYQAALEPVNPPFKTGKQTLKLKLSHQHRPVPEMPVVAVTMPMGTSTMSAPVEIKAGPTEGTFEIQTDFSMPGAWELHVKSQKELVLHFNVQ